MNTNAMTDDRDALLKRIHDLESQLAQGNTSSATPPSSPASPETPMVARQPGNPHGSGAAARR